MAARRSKSDGFEQREAIEDAYWEDPRWAEVQKLRANGLVFEIQESWGIK